MSALHKPAASRWPRWTRASQATIAVLLLFGVADAATGRLESGAITIAASLFIYGWFFSRRRATPSELQAGRRAEAGETFGGESLARSEGPHTVSEGALHQGTAQVHRHGAPDATEASTLELRRRPGGADRLWAYHMIVDGLDRGRLRRGESQVVKIAPGMHEVYMRAGGGRSRAITLNMRPDEIATLVCWPNRRALRPRPHLEEWIGLERVSTERVGGT